MFANRIGGLLDFGDTPSALMLLDSGFFVRV